MSNVPDSKIIKLLSSANNVDWQLFVTGSVILFSSIVVIVVFPEWSSATIDRLYVATTSSFGILYIITAIALLLFLLYVSVSKYGTIILGDDTSEVYSHFSWASMLFCAGIGASLIYWGATEWAFYYESPPFGIEAGSQEAILWASSYGIFHWGPIGWSFYCLPALALACSYHVKKIPSLRLSSACEPVLKSYTTKLPGRLVDLFFLAGVIATAATGLGFGTSLVSSATTELTGIADGLLLQICIILLATSLIVFSVYRGLDRGIKVLSTMNAGMALIFIAFVFLFGPTKFILEMGVASVGHAIQNFITMLFWTDPLLDGFLLGLVVSYGAIYRYVCL
jgi:BCCT family betaine/carnitine transporter